METVFQNAITRLENKGFSAIEARALVGTLRAAEDYHLASRLQDRIIPVSQSSFGQKVANIFTHGNIGVLIEEASKHAPSPNQVPNQLADQAAVLLKQLLILREANTPISAGVAALVHQLDKIETLVIPSK